MKYIKNIVLIAALLIGAAAIMPGDTVAAQVSQAQQGVDAIGGKKSPPLTSTAGTLINVFLFVIGAVAVVMIVYGGFRYVTSAGEPSAVSSAKNIILYAVVGLVVAISAYAIANFVITNTTSGGGANIPSDCTDSRGEPC